MKNMELYGNMIKAINSDTPNFPAFKAAFDAVMVSKLDDRFEARTKEIFATPTNG